VPSWSVTALGRSPEPIGVVDARAEPATTKSSKSRTAIRLTAAVR
jgi:hypothetical protein